MQGKLEAAQVALNLQLLEVQKSRDVAIAAQLEVCLGPALFITPQSEDWYYGNHDG